MSGAASGSPDWLRPTAGPAQRLFTGRLTGVGGQSTPVFDVRGYRTLMLIGVQNIVQATQVEVIWYDDPNGASEITRRVFVIRGTAQVNLPCQNLGGYVGVTIVALPGGNTCDMNIKAVVSNGDSGLTATFGTLYAFGTTLLSIAGSGGSSTIDGGFAGDGELDLFISTGGASWTATLGLVVDATTSVPLDILQGSDTAPHRIRTRIVNGQPTVKIVNNDATLRSFNVYGVIGG